MDRLESVLIELDGGLVHDIREVRSGNHPHVDPAALHERIVSAVYHALDQPSQHGGQEFLFQLTHRRRPSCADVQRALSRERRGTYL